MLAPDFRAFYIYDLIGLHGSLLHLFVYELKATQHQSLTWTYAARLDGAPVNTGGHVSLLSLSGTRGLRLV